MRYCLAIDFWGGVRNGTVSVDVFPDRQLFSGMRNGTLSVICFSNNRFFCVRNVFFFARNRLLAGGGGVKNRTLGVHFFQTIVSLGGGEGGGERNDAYATDRRYEHFFC